MSDWKIGLTPAATHGTPSIIGPLTALLAWKRLTKHGRAAVAAGYKHGLVDAHFNTMLALERHGFMHPDCRLTDAGKVVAKWMVRDE